MILLIDNFDSFTYNLYDYLAVHGGEVQTVRSNKLNELENISQFKGIVVSPGPGVPEDFPEMMQVLQEQLTKVPVLGICLGFQAIGILHGALLTRAQKPMHGKISTVQNSPHEMFKHIPENQQVCRYHSLVLEQIKPPLLVTAETVDGIPMALAHEKLPIWGVQYHPEAILTHYGKQFIENWLRLTNYASK